MERFKPESCRLNMSGSLLVFRMSLLTWLAIDRKTNFAIGQP
jgi:hypothetical protein